MHIIISLVFILMRQEQEYDEARGAVFHWENDDLPPADGILLVRYRSQFRFVKILSTSESS
jgi:hypothetical protein